MALSSETLCFEEICSQMPCSQTLCSEMLCSEMLRSRDIARGQVIDSKTKVDACNKVRHAQAVFNRLECDTIYLCVLYVCTSRTFLTQTIRSIGYRIIVLQQRQIRLVLQIPSSVLGFPSAISQWGEIPSEVLFSFFFYTNCF